jgi:hypothetical protein
MKWKYKIDQYFEDKIWSRWPAEHASPHLFFLLGFSSAVVLMFLLYIIF